MKKKSLLPPSIFFFLSLIVSSPAISQSMSTDDFKWYCKMGGGTVVNPPNFPGHRCIYPNGEVVNCRFGREGGRRVCRELRISLPDSNQPTRPDDRIAPRIDRVAPL